MGLKAALRHHRLAILPGGLRLVGPSDDLSEDTILLDFPGFWRVL